MTSKIVYEYTSRWDKYLQF